ncbi:MFS transporter [Gulosibacter massiliensis]|uniref:MFS transporter n=1 Tax=Gulosibacter massiliensis TaxID=2479839 RepID=UPI00202B23AD|nr:MFS transporter [Gulosibacter massiliensis]
MAKETNGTQPPLWRILIIALLPTFIYSVGQGAIVPVIPAVATSLGADLGFAGFIAGSLLIGQAVGNLPAGAVVSRFGERRAMVFSAFATIVGALISVFAVNAWMLLAGVLVQGLHDGDVCARAAGVLEHVRAVPVPGAVDVDARRGVPLGHVRRAVHRDVDDHRDR